MTTNPSRQSDQRTNWLETRRTGIGGSDAAAMLACHPYHSLVSLYLDKIGEGGKDNDSVRLRWGRRLEDDALDEYQFVTGRAVVDQSEAVPDLIVEPVPGVTMLRHPTAHVAIGNTDGIVVHEGGCGVVDAKSVDGFIFKKWIANGRPPLHYLVQLSHYMEITGLKWATIAAFTGLNDPLYIYEHEHDAEFGARLLEAEDTFWRRYVLRRQPPPADATENSAKALRKLYPKDNGAVINLEGPAVGWAHDFDDASAIIKDQKARLAGAKTMILATIGEATAGVLPDGSGFTFKAGKNGRSLRRTTAKSMRKYTH